MPPDCRRLATSPSASVCGSMEPPEGRARLLADVHPNQAKSDRPSGPHAGAVTRVRSGSASLGSTVSRSMVSSATSAASSRWPALRCDCGAVEPALAEPDSSNRTRPRSRPGPSVSANEPGQRLRAAGRGTWIERAAADSANPVTALVRSARAGRCSGACMQGVVAATKAKRDRQADEQAEQPRVGRSRHEASVPFRVGRAQPHRRVVVCDQPCRKLAARRGAS